MDDPKIKSYDFAQKQTELLILLSTAIITFSVTFRKEFYLSENDSWLFLLKISITFFLLSIWFGISTLGKLTSSLHAGKIDLFDEKMIWPAKAQYYLFSLGLLLAVVFTLIPVSKNVQPKLIEENTNIAQYSFLFQSGSMVISNSLNQNTINMILELLNSVLPNHKSCTIAIKGFADSQKIISPNNRIGNNFELSYARAINVQSKLSELICNSKSNKLFPIEFRLSFYSNELSLTNDVIDRKVEVTFYY